MMFQYVLCLRCLDAISKKTYMAEIIGFLTRFGDLIDPSPKIIKIIIILILLRVEPFVILHNAVSL